MRIFNVDLHISVIADFRDIVGQIRPDIEIVDWSLSGHTWVFHREPARPEIINADTWMDLTPQRLAAFQDRYDDVLRSFDAFMVGHVMPFALLFEKYDRPILAWNTCRYDLPFCFTKRKDLLPAYHDCLRRLQASGRLIAFSNNKADRDYVRLGSGLDFPCLPSLCRYTGMRHRPERTTFFWYSGAHLAPDSPLITRRDGVFTWQELETYRGIVHVPYESSTMSLCEHYSAGIPLFLPTPRLLKHWWATGRNGLQSMAAYWGADAPAVLAPCQAHDFWIDRADYYDVDNMRHIYFFDSIEALMDELRTFSDPHARARAAWIREREQRVLAAWAAALR